MCWLLPRCCLLRSNLLNALFANVCVVSSDCVFCAKVMLHHIIVRCRFMKTCVVFSSFETVSQVARVFPVNSMRSSVKHMFWTRVVCVSKRVLCVCRASTCCPYACVILCVRVLSYVCICQCLYACAISCCYVLSACMHVLSACVHFMRVVGTCCVVCTCLSLRQLLVAFDMMLVVRSCLLNARACICRLLIMLLSCVRYVLCFWVAVLYIACVLMSGFR